MKGMTLALLGFTCLAYADSILLSGHLTSDGAAVSSTDPVVNPANIQPGELFTLRLTYNPASYVQSGGTYSLTNASAVLQLFTPANAPSYRFDYASPGNYIGVSLPGAFGAGTVSFELCSTQAGCATDDFLNLYYAGAVTDLAHLLLQVSNLSGDTSASPSQFEFLRNFSDGSQTDLQGTLSQGAAASAATPEPGSLCLLALGGVVTIIGSNTRRRQSPALETL